MPEASLWFLPGREFAEVFATPSGWVIVSATVAVTGHELHLVDFDYRPLETKTLPIGARAVLFILRQIRLRAWQEGYTFLVVDGVRMYGRNPNCAVRYERRTG